jgi:hypothetical protein
MKNSGNELAEVPENKERELKNAAKTNSKRTHFWHNSSTRRSKNSAIKQNQGESSQLKTRAGK